MMRKGTNGIIKTLHFDARTMTKLLLLVFLFISDWLDYPMKELANKFEKNIHECFCCFWFASSNVHDKCELTAHGKGIKQVAKEYWKIFKNIRYWMLILD